MSLVGRLAVLLVLACSCAGRRGAVSDTALVLTEVHSTVGAAPETLITWIADRQVRVAHRGGIAILDARNDRFALLDPAAHTVRTMRLVEWEQKLRAAVQSATGAPPPEPPLQFELEGPGGDILGHACMRYHVYTTRQLFPGEWEDIEQEIWVATDLALTAAAGATYQRVIASLDWIGLDAAVQRPPGIALRTQVRRRPHPAAAPSPPRNAPVGEDTEISEVIRIDTRPAPPGVFAIPPGYRPASATDLQR